MDKCWYCGSRGSEREADLRAAVEDWHKMADLRGAALAAANEKLAESARLATESAQLADGLAKDLAAANERAGRLEEERGQLREAWSIINSEAIDEYAETLTHIVAARAMLNAASSEVPDAL